MADATIPPPEPDDTLIHLGSLLAVVERGHALNRTYVAAVIRRCHAAEAENARLRTEVDKEWSNAERGISVAEKLQGLSERMLAQLEAQKQRIAELEAALATARAEERERCAKVADECHRQDEIDNGSAMTGAAGSAAEAIRALPPTETTTG